MNKLRVKEHSYFLLFFAINSIFVVHSRAEEPLPHAPASSPSESPLEARLRKLEEQHAESERRHADEYQALSEKYEALKRQVVGEKRPTAGTDAREAVRSELVAPERSSTNRADNLRESSGVGAEGTGGRTFIRESQSGGKAQKTAAKVFFSEGLEFASDDEEFKLTFHNLTQVDYRAFPASDRGTLQSQFVIPRERWYFTGQATRNVEFYTVINRGYGSLDVLDAFVTFNILGSLSDRDREAGNPLGAQGTGGRTAVDRGKGNDGRLRLRLGRMKTPYLYEYFSIAEGDLIAPERSLYAGNLADNRQIGAMFLGELFDERLTYATGIFDGPRRSYQDYNSNLDAYLYLNSRPFLKSEVLPALKYLNIGADVNGGLEDNPTQPGVFRTANDQTSSPAAAGVSPTFLTLNNNVVEYGYRNQWSANVAWFYKSMMLLGEVAGGTQGYSTNHRFTTQVPNRGWMVQGAYFLTGEELTRRVNVVRPKNNFGYKNGKFGTGAIEVHGRFSEIDLGNQIFTSGFADQNLWTNRAYAIDVGANWYLNYYTKVYFDWQHAVYANSVTTGRPGHFMNNSDLFWLRFQLFF